MRISYKQAADSSGDRGRYRQPRLWLAAWLLPTLFVSDPALAEYRGRSVSQVLDELRSRGLTFIYSSQLLPRSVRVLTEPGTNHGLGLAREILAEHGLSLAEAAPQVYAVIAAPSSEQFLPGPHSPVAAGTIDEVVVQTSRYDLAPADIATGTFLTQEQVKNMPRLADETLRAVQRLPGTASNGFASMGPVRGGEPGETAIILNGLRLYEPFHLKNFLNPVSVLDSRMIEGIEFYSGGFPAVYGDHMSAVIDATAIRPGESRYYELGLNLFHASALASGRFADGKGGALVSGRRSNVGDLAHLSEREFGEPQYSDAFGHVEYAFGEATLATFDVLVSSDAIDASNSVLTEVASAEYRNLYTWATIDHDWSGAASSRLIASFTGLSNERSASIDEPDQRVGSVSDERNFNIYGLRLENAYQGDRLSQRFGGEIRYLRGTYNYASEVRLEPGFPFPGSPGSIQQRTLSPEPDGYEGSLFWDGRVQLGQRWTMQSGLRLDTQTYDGLENSRQWSPRLSVMYEPRSQTRWRATWGRYYQAQSINELQVEDGIDRFHPAQYADHAIVSFDHFFEAGIDLRVEAYRKHYRRLFARFENLFDPLVLFPEAEFDRVRIDTTGARAQGIELMLKLRPRGSWSGWLSYSAARVEDRVAGRDELRSWDQAQAVNLGLVWTRGPWAATLANTYHSGWPITPLAVTTQGGEPRLVVDARNTDRLASFNTLDLRVTRTFIMPRGALDVFVEVNNAISRENPCCIGYEFGSNEDGSLRVSRDLDTWLPLVPSAGVLWRY